MIRKYQEVVQQLFNIELTIGISNDSSSIKDIKVNYKEAFRLTNYKLINGKGSILTNASILHHHLQKNTAYLQQSLKI